MIKRPRVRIAPSPTGDPHVGTAYMSLFDYAYVRRNGGAFVLRIEDTDQTRYSHESEQRIIAALRWLGLEPDEGPGIGGDYGPYRQSERLPIYRRYADELVARGHAYPCFCTKERLDALRKEQEAARQPTGYDRHCRGIAPSEARRRVESGEGHVIRLAVPREGSTIVDDLIRGRVEFENTKLSPDPVLMKSDGFPTYHLAHMVDDYLMEITTVVRGEEWLPSAPLHVILYDYFGWEQPERAHMPLLRNADKSKVSKRKNNTSLEWYRDNGYLPEAMLNFLASNGWSMPDGREQFSLADMVAYFSWDRVVTTGPVFDLTRLTSLNSYYLQRKTLHELRELFLPLVPEGTDKRYVDAIIPLVHERIQRVEGAALAPNDIVTMGPAGKGTIKQGEPLPEAGASFPDYTTFFFAADALDYEPARLVPKKGTPAAALALLEAARETLAGLTLWETRTIEPALRGLAEARGVKVGDLLTSIRVAVTGSAASPPLFETVAVLGPEPTLARLDSAIERLY